MRQEVSDRLSRKEKTSWKPFRVIGSIDNLSYRTISFGFPLLTMGIIAGAVWPMKLGVRIGVGILKKLGL